MIKKPGKPQTEAQRTASKENWNLLQLKHFIHQSEHLQYQGVLTQEEGTQIRVAAWKAVDRIRLTQKDRMKNKLK